MSAAEIYQKLLPSLQWSERKELSTRCPLHNDENPSLSINTTSGKWFCHACNEGGAPVDLFMKMKGVDYKTAQKILKQTRSDKKKIVATYDYIDEVGRLLYQVVRFEPKDFRQRRPDGNGGYIWNVHGIRQVPKNLPAVLKAETVVVIVEGEKDCETLEWMGITATTNSCGAGKWRPEYNEYFRNKEVIILPDNDDTGKKHSQTVAQNLYGIAKSIKVVSLPGIPEKGDVSDWVESEGNDKDKFLNNVNATQEYIPAESESLYSFDNRKLIERFGKPYYLNRNETVTGINEAYWAGLYADKHIIMYEPDEKAFYLYCNENGLHSVISGDLIKQDIARSILDASRVNNVPSLEEYKDNSNLNHIVANLKGITEKRHAFKRDRRFIHVVNGVILFNDNGDADLCEFSPEFYSRNQSPIAFDPTARCNRFLNELVYPAVTLDDALLLQKFAGMCLLGNNLVQRFLILDGLPGRGKTQVVLVIQKIVGQLNVSELRTKHLSDRFELYRYLKKTLLVGVDVPGNFLSEKGAYVIKGLVGGDIFDAEQKGGTGCFPLQGNFCIMMTSNSRLQVRLDGDLGAWRRRLLIVRYEAPAPAKKIPNFADILIKEEGSGILNWALHGLALLFDDIDKYGDIRLAPAQADIVDRLLAESDSLRIFLRECIDNDEHHDLSTAEIIERYAQYCPVKKWNPKPITIIYREIEGLMLELFGSSKAHSITRDGKSVKGFRRVRFRTEGGTDE